MDAMPEGSPALQIERSFSSNEIVLNLVARHYLADHEAICNFAFTSKWHKELMITTAKERRKNKVKYACPVFYSLGQWVHRFGSAHCFAYEQPGLETSITLGFFKITDGDTVEKGQTFGRVIQPLKSHQPYFNEESNMCFYGYGERRYDHFDQHTERNVLAIMHYCTDGSVMPCAIQIPDGKLWLLTPLLSYPSLLQAVLATATRKKAIIADAHHSIPYLIFSLDNFIVPKDYKERAELNSHLYKEKIKFSYCSKKEDPILGQYFEEFPDYIRNTIEKLYQKQQEDF
jgi:hypothetical protein